jgi:hypothetical protein
VETTVVSYLTARPSRNLRVAAPQEIPADWWLRRRPHFDLYVSVLVVNVSKRCAANKCHRNEATSRASGV